MELSHLQSFIAVAQAGTLSKAALVRHLSLPGISKHIKLLEESLGSELFVRSSSGMKLTPKGELVLEHALSIQNSVTSLQQLSRPSGPLRLGLNLSPDFLDLASLMALIADEHPQLEVALTHLNSDELLSLLASRELDICLAFGDVKKELRSMTIRRVVMPLMVPSTLPLENLELNAQRWTVNRERCPFLQPLKSFWQEHGIAPLATIQATDLTRREIVAQGLGIGFLEPQDALQLLLSGKGRWFRGSQVEVALSLVIADDRWLPLCRCLKNYINARYDRVAMKLAETSPVGG